MCILNTLLLFTMDSVSRGPHPSIRPGVSLGAHARWDGQCHAQFDSKAGRTMQVGTNSGEKGQF